MKVMRFDEANHEREKHGGNGVECRKVRLRQYFCVCTKC